MSKAVLVIDMPKRCKDCFRYRADPWYGGRCTQAKEKIEADDEYNVQNWCPLRPYKNSIPIEWIEEWVKTSIPHYDYDRMTYIADVYEMLDDWEEENEKEERTNS